MANAKRKKKPLSNPARRKTGNKKSTRPRVTKTRRRAVVKNAQRKGRRVVAVNRKRSNKVSGKRRQIANRKSGRVAGRKIKTVGRSVSARRGRVKKVAKVVTGSRAARAVVPPGVVENYRENFFTIVLDKGNFSTKLEQVKALDLKFIERYSFHPQYLIAIKLFVTLTGKDDKTGGTYFLNHTTPFSWVALPRNVRKFLVRMVQWWQRNFHQRQEAGTLDLEKDYDRASKPNNLKEIKVTFIYTKGAGGYGEY